MRNGWLIDKYNSKYHYVDDIAHNDDGPAIIWHDDSLFWVKNGKDHREDGPSYEGIDGIRWWYYDGHFVGSSISGYTQEKFEEWKRFRAFF